jgi:hypothetical protein
VIAVVTLYVLEEQAAKRYAGITNNLPRRTQIEEGRAIAAYSPSESPSSVSGGPFPVGNLLPQITPLLRRRLPCPKNTSRVEDSLISIREKQENQLGVKAEGPEMELIIASRKVTTEYVLGKLLSVPAGVISVHA